MVSVACHFTFNPLGTLPLITLLALLILSSWRAQEPGRSCLVSVSMRRCRGPISSGWALGRMLKDEGRVSSPSAFDARSKCSINANCYCYCVCVCRVCVWCVWCVTGAACTWRSEVSFLEEPVLSFHCMGPRGQMQIVSTGSRSLPLPAPCCWYFLGWALRKEGPSLTLSGISSASSPLGYLLHLPPAC